jgi:hypothetical protein
VRGVDIAGNKKPTAPSNNEFVVGTDSNTFTYDIDAPEIVITRPLQSATTPVYNAMDTISGTAVDKPDSPLYSAGIENIYAQVYYLLAGDTYYFTDNADPLLRWSSETVSEFLVTGTTDWTYTPGNVWNWEIDKLYFTKARIQDKADNAIYVINKSRIDDQPPTAGITLPDETNVGTVPTISGTASDAASGNNGISNVKIRIKNISLGTTFYTGTEWINDPGQDTWFDVTTPGEIWDYTIEFDSDVWTDGNEYQVNAKSYDGAMADNTPNESDISGTISFKYDKTPPASYIEVPQTGFYKEVTTISGTATDSFSGIDGNDPVRMTIRRTGESPPYLQTKTPETSDDGWGSDPVDLTHDDWVTLQDLWKIYVATTVWKEGEIYEITIKAKDKAGNTEPAGSVVTVTIDRTEPQYSVITPEDNIYYSSLATITGTANDIGPAGIKEVLFGVERLDDTQYLRETPSFGFESGSMVWISTDTVGTSWKYTRIADESKWITETEYELYVRVVDNADNITQWTTTYFRYDRTPPTSDMESPILVDYRSSELSVSSGTCSDGGGVGVDNVKLRIQRSDGEWYTGLGWTGGTEDDWPWVLTPSGGIWTKNIAGGFWQTGYSYKINSRAEDKVTEPSGANYEVNFATHIYCYDTTFPEIGIDIPVDLEYYNTLTITSGTVNDPTIVTGGAASDINKVDISIKRESDGYYWCGSSFDVVGSVAWSSTTLTEILPTTYTWTYDFEDTYWTDNTSYTVQVKTYDNAGNSKVSNSNYFIFDTSAPTSYVTYPAGLGPEGGNHADYIINNIPTISGTAGDYGIGNPDKVYLELMNSDIEYYSGFDPGGRGDYWVSYATSVEVSVSGNEWAFETAGVTVISFKDYDVRCKPVDKAGNIGLWSEKRIFRYEPPRAQSVVTNVENNKFYSSIINIVGTATEDPAATEIDLRIERKTDGYYWSGITGDWVNYSTWTTFTVIPPDWSYGHANLKFVHSSSYTVASKAWRDSPVVPEYNTAPPGPAPNVMPMFTIDSTAPVSGLTLPDKSYVNNLPTLSGTADDDLAGVDNVFLQIAYSTATTFWSATLREWVDYSTWSITTYPGDTPGSWKFTSSTPTLQNLVSYRVKTLTRDKSISANEYESSWFTVTYDLVSPTATISSVENNDIMSDVSVIQGDFNELPADALKPISEGGIRIVVKDNDYIPVAKYWDGSVWVLAHTSNNVTAIYTSSWSYNMPVLDNTFNEHRFTLIVQAEDIAGNVQTNYEVGISTLSFEYDTEAPVTDNITYPGKSGINPDIDFPAVGFFNFQGELTDNLAGAASVYLQLSRIQESTTYYWTGSSWTVNSAQFKSGELNPIGGGVLPAPPADWLHQFLKANAYSDQQYNIKVQGIDNALPGGNAESWDSGYDFAVDTTPPVSIVDYPPAGSLLNSLTQVTGTANGFYCGLEMVEIKISSNSSGVDVYTWTGSSWSPNTHWVDTNNDTSGFGNVAATWTYTASAGLNHGATYYIVSRAKDIAGNYDVTLSTIQILCDKAAPEVVMTRPNPVGYGYYGAQVSSNPITSITGTASDVTTSVKSVEIRICDITAAPVYWSGIGWVVDSSTWVAVSGTDSWTYASPGWDDGHEYRVNSRGYDITDNLSDMTTATFLYDETYPEIVLQKPDVDYHNILPGISGTATDPLCPPPGNRSGIDKIQVAIRRIVEAPVKWWDNVNKDFLLNIEEDAYFDATDQGPTPWFVTGADTPTWVNGGEYLVKCRVIDKAQNISTMTVFSKQFVFDTTKPTVKLMVPDPARDRYRVLPTISGTADDEDPDAGGDLVDSWIEKVYLRIFRVTDGTYWENDINDWDDGIPASLTPDQAWFAAGSSVAPSYSIWYTTFSWEVNTEYRVEARTFDNAANICVSYSTATFTYDTSPPESYVSNPADEVVVKELYTISGTAVDSAGGTVTSVKLGVRNNKTGNWWNTSDFLGTQNYYSTNLSGGGGGGIGDWATEEINFSSTTLNSELQAQTSYYVEPQSRDSAGNDESIPNSMAINFWVDRDAPQSVIQSPLNGRYSSITGINGTCSDDAGAGIKTAGIEQVKVQIKRDVSWCWEGPPTNDWINDPDIFNVCVDSENWSYDTSQVTWETGKTYTITVRSTDTVGNLELPGDSVVVVYDTAAPNALITRPPEDVVAGQYYGTTPSLSTISGTASDAGLGGSQIVSVQIAMREGDLATPGPWWNPAQSTFNITGAGPEFNISTVTWAGSVWTTTTPVLQTGYIYTVYCRAEDELGNQQTSPYPYQIFIYDDEEPYSKITIPDKPYVKYLPTISGTAEDKGNNPSGLNANAAKISIKYSNQYWDPNGALHEWKVGAKIPIDTVDGAGNTWTCIST